MNTILLLKRAREMVNIETPLLYDCGARCNAACCQADEDGKGGMYLFPGEEKLYEDSPWAHIERGDLMAGSQNVMLLTCGGTCIRSERPLSCRVFPLTPYVREGRLVVKPDVRAWPVCPLMPCGMKGLRQSFVASVYGAMKMLWADEACRAYIIALTKWLDQFSDLA